MKGNIRVKIDGKYKTQFSRFIITAIRHEYPLAYPMSRFGDDEDNVSKHRQPLTISQA